MPVCSDCGGPVSLTMVPPPDRCDDCARSSRERERNEAAERQLREMLAKGEVDLPLGQKVEVAVFGEHFTVERRAPTIVDDSGELLDGALTIERDWLKRDEVVGGLCRYCAGDGLSFYLSSARRAMLRQWTKDEGYIDPVSGRHGIRAVRGVCFDHPFAAWLLSTRADRLLEQYGILESEARCERCGGWGDDRLREASRAAR